MANMMQFDLVSPERRLASVQATSVQIPGSEGDLTAMPDHSPMITTLRPGVLRVEGPDGTLEYAVTGGFADVSGPATSVLAEQAMPVSEMTSEIMAGLIQEAEAKLADANEDVAD
ncbi:MAG: F-type H+-transporting ATPase subunit epsilon, partial [Paracoccaceae bacterium]